ncbi:MAG: hypothetical protein MJD61_02925 [Proteobacteria bacterium]|nr:hypothetical protein [Pseudomonadota bacterium]
MKLSVTGLGVVGPLGVGRRRFFELLRGGAAAEHAFGPPLDVLSPQHAGNTLAAQVRDFDAGSYLGRKGLRNFDRLTKFLIVAAKLALEDARIKRNGSHLTGSPERVGVCSATAYGSLDAITELNLVAEFEDPRFLNPNRFPNTVINSPSAYVGIWENLRGPNVTIVDGNCGALDGVLSSQNHLAHHRADMFLVGGGEVLSEPLYLAFRKLGALAEQPSGFAPGSPASKGMRLGEGAVYLCIEPPEAAKARGACIRAEIVGYGAGFEPPPSEASLVHVSKSAILRALRNALADACLSPQDVDVVCSAACGIPHFDSTELNAVEEFFGADISTALPKALLGETLGASGAFALATVLAWFAGAPVVPLVGRALRSRPRTAVVITLGYYGNVSVVVVRRCEQEGHELG